MIAEKLFVQSGEKLRIIRNKVTFFEHAVIMRENSVFAISLNDSMTDLSFMVEDGFLYPPILPFPYLDMRYYTDITEEYKK
jgi:hypothetical protein